MEIKTIAENIFRKVRKEHLAQPSAIGFFLDQFEKRKIFSLKFSEDLISSVVKEGYPKSDLLLLSDFLELSFFVKDDSNLLDFKNELAILAIQDIQISNISEDIHKDLCILDAISPNDNLKQVLRNLSFRDKSKLQMVLHLFTEFISSRPGEIEELLKIVDSCELQFKEEGF